MLRFRELQHETNKIHYMIHTMFDNNDCDDDEIVIKQLDDTHYTVRVVDLVATELNNDNSYNCTVNIAIGQYSAVCEVLPDDRMCDPSYFIFQYQQVIPMHYEIIYK